jgi:hypothetical protein
MRAVLFVVLCLSLVAADIYATMKEGDVKCYFEDVPQVSETKKKYAW